MQAHDCSFCKARGFDVSEMRICDRCAQHRAGDKYCDFCRSMASATMAWICPKCVVKGGRVGDDRCDKCNQYGRANIAMICNSCAR